MKLENITNEEEIIKNYYNDISSMIEISRNKVYYAVNIEMLNLYWNIGKKIMNIQEGVKRAKYGKKILDEISKKLTDQYGNGFSRDNLERMRKFYNCFSNCATVSRNLSWSHYVELINMIEHRKGMYELFKNK